MRPRADTGRGTHSPGADLRGLRMGVRCKTSRPRRGPRDPIREVYHAARPTRKKKGKVEAVSGHRKERSPESPSKYRAWMKNAGTEVNLPGGGHGCGPRGKETPFAAGHLVDNLFFLVERDGKGEVQLLLDEVVYDAGKPLRPARP
jgi:hypothetical protein